jgi:O-acetyl-ADP-ribose deacetylase (regulator of RNase III)
MISYIQKDITTIDRGIIAHGVNCQGVMGSGVAAAIIKKWPIVYDRYIHFYKEQDGAEELLGLTNTVNVKKDLHVANLFSQRFYGKDGRVYANVKAIYTGMVSIIKYAIAVDLPIIIPKIGCGLGGLDWDKDVLPAIEKAMRDTYPTVDIYVCEL